MNLRAWPAYLLAASVPISLAATSLSKLLVLLVAMAILVIGLARHVRVPFLAGLASARTILLMLCALALSMLWTTAPLDAALGDIGKYAKLLLILLMPLLLRSRREVVIALGCFVVAQTFVVATSWALVAGFHPPWVYKVSRTSLGTVFSSYLDQSIMTAGLAAVCWHLRGEFPGRRGAWWAIGLALVSTVNVLFMLPGRSGQVAMIAVVTLALFWYIPRRWRLAAVFAPVVLVAFAVVASPQFKYRLNQVVSESRAYNSEADASTSSGQRLNFWHRSLQAIQERPLTGFGVGSWNQQYTRLEDGHPSAGTAQVRNPHQEYLLWGVQLGMAGIVLLLAFFASLMRDAQRFAAPVRHAMKSLVAVAAVACLFNSSLFDALIGDYLCTVIGLLLALGLRGEPAARTRSETGPLPVPAQAAPHAASHPA